MITKLCYNFFLFFFETFIFSKYLVSPRYLIFILSSQVIFSDYLILSFQFLGVKYLILSFWTKKKDRKHCPIRPHDAKWDSRRGYCLIPNSDFRLIYGIYVDRTQRV
jgi:hypothetical protein